MSGGRGAARRRLRSSRFSWTLRLHSASDMAVPVEMDCRPPDRFAAVVSHVLGSIPSFLESSFELIFVAEERASRWT